MIVKGTRVKKSNYLLYLLLVTFISISFGRFSSIIIGVQGKNLFISISQILLTILFFLFIIKSLMYKNKLKIILFPLLPYIVFGLYTLLIGLGAIDVLRAVGYAINPITGVIFAFLVLNILRKQGDIKYILERIDIIGVIISIFVVFVFLYNLDVTILKNALNFRSGAGASLHWINMLKNKVSIPLGRSNYIASFLLFLIMYNVTVIPKFKKRSNLLLLIYLGALLCTLSRGGLFALILTIIFMLSFFSIRKNKRLRVFSFVILGLASILILLIGFSFFYNYFFVGNSVQVRLTLIKYGIEAFTDHPLFGIGLGNFSFENLEIHNITVLLLAETGIIGFILYGLLYIYTFFNLSTIRKYFILNKEEQSYWAGISFGLIAMIIHAQFEIVMLSFYYELFFGFIFGLILAEKHILYKTCKEKMKGENIQ